MGDVVIVDEGEVVVVGEEVVERLVVVVEVKEDVVGVAGCGVVARGMRGCCCWHLLSVVLLSVGKRKCLPLLVCPLLDLSVGGRQGQRR